MTKPASSKLHNRHNTNVLRVAMAPWSCLVLLAVTVPYFLSKGLTLTEIFLGHSALSITLGLCELPSGYLSDRYSRKATLLIAAAAKAGAGICAVYTASLPMLLLTYAFIGIAISFFSGTDLAIIHDSYGADERGITHEMATLALISNISSTVGIILGGILSSYSLHTAAMANAAIACLPFFIFLALKFPDENTSPAVKNAKPSLSPESMLAKARRVLTHDFRTAKKVLLDSRTDTALLFGLIVLLKVPTIMALLTFQSIFAEIGLSTSEIGFIIGATYVLCGFAAKLIPTIEQRLAKQAIIVLSFFIAAISYLAMAAPTVITAIAAFIALELVKTCMFVYFVKEYNRHLEPALRATLNSVQSLASRIVLAAFAPLWGFAMTQYGSQTATLACGVFYLGVTGIVVAHFWTKRGEPSALRGGGY